MTQGRNYFWIEQLKGKKLGRASSVKNYCKLQCCAGDTISWKNCSFNACLLWKWRFGREVTDSKEMPSENADFIAMDSEKGASGEESGGQNDKE